MKRAILAIGCLVFLAGLIGAANPLTPQQKLKAWRDSTLAQVPDEPGLPRVLLLGDSISMGYTVQVREALRGVANVHRPAENCFSTAVGLKRLDTWLASGKWDVIHFNFGLHDNNYLDDVGRLVDPAKGKLAVTPAQYEANLREIVRRLQRTEAKLIFATTTPIPKDSPGRRAGAEVAYNEAASRVMKEMNVAVDDLHAYVVAHPGIQRPKNVHFTDEGYEQLAALVTECIRAALVEKGYAQSNGTYVPAKIG